MEWLTSSIRLTSFVQSPRLEDYVLWADQIWNELGCGDPETSSNAPRKAQALRIGTNESGHLYTLTVAPDRADLTISAIPEDPFRIASLGTVANARELGVTVLSRYLQQLPSLVRVAAGGIFLSAVDSQAAQRALFAQVVPAFRPDEETSDVLVRANRVIASAVANGLRINQMANWEMFSSLVVAVAGAGGLSPMQGTQAFGVSCNLDINTAAENTTPLAGPDRLYRELLDLMVRRIGRGEA